MPRVSALLDVAQISDITAIESSDTFERPIYAGNCIATVQNSDSKKVITVRTTAFDAHKMMEVLRLLIFKKAITLEYQSS